jgi:hypothetical protein
VDTYFPHTHLTKSMWFWPDAYNLNASNVASG